MEDTYNAITNKFDACFKNWNCKSSARGTKARANRGTVYHTVLYYHVELRVRRPDRRDTVLWALRWHRRAHIVVSCLSMHHLKVSGACSTRIFFWKQYVLRYRDQFRTKTWCENLTDIYGVQVPPKPVYAQYSNYSQLSYQPIAIISKLHALEAVYSKKQ